jgi:serine/threonine-protein kinase RsbW
MRSRAGLRQVFAELSRGIPGPRPITSDRGGEGARIASEAQSPHVTRLSLPSAKSELPGLRGWLREILADPRLSESAVHDIVLAVHEAVVNAMVHGNRLAVDRRVEVRVEFCAHGVEVEVADEGPGFDWAHWFATLQARGVPPDSPNGRGIRVLTCIMDDVAYNSAGNVLRLGKRYDR